MLAYDWPLMDTCELVLLGERRTAEYKKLIRQKDGQNAGNLPVDVSYNQATRLSSGFRSSRIYSAS